MSVSWRASGTNADNGGSATTITNSSLTVPVGITNGTVLAILSVDSLGQTVTNAAPTCNTHAMTLVADYQITSNQRFLQIYAFLQSQSGWATGAQTITWTPTSWSGSGSAYLDVVCFDGVNQVNAATAFTNSNTKTAATAANDVLITTAANNAVVAVFGGIPASANYTVAGGGTPGQSIISAADGLFGHGCEYHLTTSGTSFDMTWTASAAATWYALGVNIVAAAAGGIPLPAMNLSVMP